MTVFDSLDYLMTKKIEIINYCLLSFLLYWIKIVSIFLLYYLVCYHACRLYIVEIFWLKICFAIKRFLLFLFNLPEDVFKDFNASEFWLYREKSLQCPCIIFCN